MVKKTKGSKSKGGFIEGSIINYTDSTIGLSTSKTDIMNTGDIGGKSYSPLDYNNIDNMQSSFGNIGLYSGGGKKPLSHKMISNILNNLYHNYINNLRSNLKQVKDSSRDSRGSQGSRGSRGGAAFLTDTFGANNAIYDNNLSVAYTDVINPGDLNYSKDYIYKTPYNLQVVEQSNFAI